MKKGNFILVAIGVILGILSFFPRPSYDTYKIGMLEFKDKKSVENKFFVKAPYLEFHNKRLNIYFTSKAGLFGIKMETFLSKLPHYVAIEYIFKPVNYRAYVGKGLKIGFHTKKEQLKKYYFLPTTFFSRIEVIPFPYDIKNIFNRIYFFQDIPSNFRDNYILSLKNIYALKSFPFYLKIWTWIYNYKILFFLLFSIWIVYFYSKKMDLKKRIVLIMFFVIIIFNNYLSAIPLDKLSPLFADAGERCGYFKWAMVFSQSFIKGFSISNGIIHWPPLWPFILGIVLKIFQDIDNIIYFMFFMKFLILFLSFILFLRISSFFLSLLTVFLINVYPESWHISYIFYSENLFLIFLLSSLIFLTDFYKTLNFNKLIFSSLFLLMAIHTRQEVFLLFLGLFFYFIIEKKFRRFAIPFLLLIFIGCLPYLIRNYLYARKHGSAKIVFVSSTFGQNLLMGNNPLIEKITCKTRPFISGENALKSLVDKNSIPQFKNEMERDIYLRNVAITFIKNNPKKFVRLLIHKAKIYFCSQYYKVMEISFFFFHIQFPSFVKTFILGVLGILLYYIKNNAKEVLVTFFLWTGVNFSIAVIFFLKEERHHWLIMPFLLFGVSYIISSIFLFLKNKLYNLKSHN